MLTIKGRGSADDHDHHPTPWRGKLSPLSSHKPGTGWQVLSMSRSASGPRRVTGIWKLGGMEQRAKPSPGYSPLGTTLWWARSGSGTWPPHCGTSPHSGSHTPPAPAQTQDPHEKGKPLAPGLISNLVSICWNHGSRLRTLKFGRKGDTFRLRKKSACLLLL